MIQRYIYTDDDFGLYENMTKKEKMDINHIIIIQENESEQDFVLLIL